ncbi:M48 family metalloprotease [Psychrobacter sp. JCM 18901]|uniref:M48 family metalloprotease n=1 Tax=Psychrobacter sp. JCM 18901 TaxID=1298609 RepID=UPI0004BADD8E|nr:M48 family metalloprotease [Psychrobacter sp. JCM 18901]
MLSKQKGKRHFMSVALPSSIKVGLSMMLLAMASGAHSRESQTLPLADSSWQVTDPQTLELPNLRGQGLSFAEQYQNKMLGEWSLQNINGRVRMEHDPWVQETIKDMTWRLNAQARQQAPLGVVIIDNPSINAFAAPGGVIGINTGTILSASSMDELASVVAHEVAHISQRHYESGADERKKSLADAARRYASRDCCFSCRW